MLLCGTAMSRVLCASSERTVSYDSLKRTGIAISKLGTGRAVAIGAYEVAINEMNARSAKAEK